MTTADPSPPAAGGHDAALDGFRGLAIWLVLFHHLTPYLSATSPSRLDRGVAAVVAQGWVGVDLFFVLSGFLITGILLDARGRPDYFRNFYARRFLRIFPLYYALLAFYFLLAPSLPGVRLDTTATFSPWWYLTFTTNLPFAFAAGSARPLFFISWSLCIEEQFYLAWPWVVRRCRDRTVAGLAVAAVAVSVACRAVCWWHGWGAGPGYLLTPCRLDGLGIGALLAVAVRAGFVHRVGRQAWSIAAVVGAIACVAALAVVHDPEITRVGQLAVFTPLAVAAGLAVAALVVRRPGGLADRVFRSPPFVVAGRLSYGLYLLHGLLARVADRVVPHLHLRTVGGSRLPEQLAYWAVALGLSWAAAAVSWRLLERPALSLKRYFPSGVPAAV